MGFSPRLFLKKPGVVFYLFPAQITQSLRHGNSVSLERVSSPSALESEDFGWRFWSRFFFLWQWYPILNVDGSERNPVSCWWPVIYDGFTLYHPRPGGFLADISEASTVPMGCIFLLKYWHWVHQLEPTVTWENRAPKDWQVASPLVMYFLGLFQVIMANPVWHGLRFNPSFLYPMHNAPFVWVDLAESNPKKGRFWRWKGGSWTKEKFSFWTAVAIISPRFCLYFWQRNTAKDRGVEGKTWWENPWKSVKDKGKFSQNEIGIPGKVTPPQN